LRLLLRIHWRTTLLVDIAGWYSLLLLLRLQCRTHEETVTGASTHGSKTAATAAVVVDRILICHCVYVYSAVSFAILLLLLLLAFGCIEIQPLPDSGFLTRARISQDEQIIFLYS